MKKLLQKTLTLLFLLFIYYCNISAQAFNASYYYDANGNRYLATITYLTTNVNLSLLVPLDTVINKKDTLIENTSKLPNDGWINGSIDSSLNMTIRIYPNPVHGILLVEISNVSNDQLNNANNVLRVCNIKGEEILTVQPLNYYNSVDMSAMPDGLYVINILINGNTKNYKVIKN